MGVGWWVWSRTAPDRRSWPVWARLRNTRSTQYPIVLYNQEGGLGDQSILSASENIRHR